MKHVAVTVLAAALIVVPGYAMAAGQGMHSSQSSQSSQSSSVGIDARVLTNAKVEQDGQNVGSIEKLMVNPNTGRIEHVDIKMTKGQNRTVSVPWSDLKVQQDSSGNVTVALQGQAANMPAASPRTDNGKSSTNPKSNGSDNQKSGGSYR